MAPKFMLLLISCNLFKYTLSANTVNQKLKQASNGKSSQPVHVALVSGCDSHLSGLTPLAYSLLHHPSATNKYRVTFVIGSQCKSTAEKLGVDFYDTGVWYFYNALKNATFAEFQRNISMGPIIYAIPAVESLVRKDKPDLIIAEIASAYVSIIAEQHKIPYATLWSIVMPHPAQFEAGLETDVGIFGLDYFDLAPDAPRWIRQMFSLVLRTQIMVYFWLYKHEAVATFNLMLKEKGFNKEYQDYAHVFNSFPSLALAGLQPIAPPALHNLGNDLSSFIDQSNRDILYIALGTVASFSDGQFEIMRDALLKQQYYNVIWAHSAYNAQKYDGTFDSKRLFIRNKQPQKEILSLSKVKVFLTHCGAASLFEGVSNNKIFIGCPQIRDQFFGARALARNKIGTIISSLPSEREILDSIEQIYSKYTEYLRNVDGLRYEMEKDSVANLERIIDGLVAKRGIVSFDMNSSNIMPLWKAWAVIAALIITFISVLWVIVSLLYQTVLKCRTAPKKKVSKNRKMK
ncbi:NDP-glycosyltransferase YjiC-like isoform X2 [Convolutriloba macropyga]|uniref:NDP-glycosyltransferase YjiC-like isoform X2 n=1 Tax=Convolutriloba macropyga TaxID=536237 RepID=UPI003F522F07